jgi:hypothetical protein
VRVHGTTKWTYSRKLQFTKGVYFLWAHATNSSGKTTRDNYKKRIFFRLR